MVSIQLFNLKTQKNKYFNFATFSYFSLKKSVALLGKKPIKNPNKVGLFEKGGRFTYKLLKKIVEIS